MPRVIPATVDKESMFEDYVSMLTPAFPNFKEVRFKASDKGIDAIRRMGAFYVHEILRPEEKMKFPTNEAEQQWRFVKYARSYKDTITRIIDSPVSSPFPVTSSRAVTSFLSEHYKSHAGYQGSDACTLSPACSTTVSETVEKERELHRMDAFASRETVAGLWIRMNKSERVGEAAGTIDPCAKIRDGTKSNYANEQFTVNDVRTCVFSDDSESLVMYLLDNFYDHAYPGVVKKSFNVYPRPMPPVTPEQLVERENFYREKSKMYPGAIDVIRGVMNDRIVDNPAPFLASSTRQIVDRAWGLIIDDISKKGNIYSINQDNPEKMLIRNLENASKTAVSEFIRLSMERKAFVKGKNVPMSDVDMVHVVANALDWISKNTTFDQRTRSDAIYALNEVLVPWNARLRRYH